MQLAVLAIAIFVAGDRFARWLWAREAGAGRTVEPPALFGRASAAMLFGFAFWVAINWLLSPLHAVSRWPLLATAVTLAGGSFLLPLPRPERRRRWLPQSMNPLLAAGTALALLAVLGWAAFVLWRGAVVWTANHDALSYHLPKAVLVAQAHGFGVFEALDARITWFPCDYELLLSNFILLDGSDRITEWLGTLTWFGLMLSAAALAERWWGRGIHLLATAVAVGCVPVILLHSGADKNDLMTAMFFVQAMLWGARWWATAEWPAAVSTVVAGALAIGTKPTGAMLVLAVGLPLLVRLVRRQPCCAVRRPLLALGAVLAASFTLLGGAAYVVNLVETGSPIGKNVVPPGYGGGWGQLANLLWYPPLALMAPFARHDAAVWVPWRHSYWFWPRYEMFFSSFGHLLTLLVLAAPVLWYLGRRRPQPGCAPGERRMLLVMAAVTTAAILPLRLEPFGLFAGCARYLMFVPAVLMAWAIPALFLQLARLRRAAPWAIGAALVGLTAVFAADGLRHAEHDLFAPLPTVLAISDGRLHPRTVPILERSTNLVDRIAGPRDHVAIDGGWDLWVYPVLGQDLGRPISYIPPGPGPVLIPDEARWVVVEYFQRLGWGAPGLENTSQLDLIGNGQPHAEDLRVLRYCLAHPEEWEPVYVHARMVEAVFKRRR